MQPEASQPSRRPPRNVARVVEIRFLKTGSVRGALAKCAVCGSRLPAHPHAVTSRRSAQIIDPTSPPPTKFAGSPPATGAGKMTAARKPQSQGSRELMHEMSIWATQHRPKLILTEYMRRLVLAQPPDPLEFLKNEIRTNPVVPGPYNIEEPDARPVAEQEKRLDVRSLNTKKASLRRVFDRFANKEGLVKVAKLLVDCEENPTILLEACPKHARDLPLALEKVVTEGGLMDWAAFRDCGLQCMSGPGLSPGQEAD